MTERYVIRLVSEFKDRGYYRVFFDGREHPPGRYRIELHVGKMIFFTDMIKVADEDNGTVTGHK